MFCWDRDISLLHLSIGRLKGLLSISIAFSFALASAAVASGSPQGDIPLEKQLEGLGPEPKLAYLRYLLGEGAEDAELMFHMGLTFHEMGRSDSALHYYERAVRIDERMFKAYVNMGVIYDDQGKVFMAIDNYNRALRIKPDEVLANSHIALLYYQNKKYDSAMSHLMKALKSDPGNPQPHFYLAIFFWDSMMYTEAMAEWKKVIELAPDDFLASKAAQNIDMVRRVMRHPSVSKGWKPHD